MILLACLGAVRNILATRAVKDICAELASLQTHVTNACLAQVSLRCRIKITHHDLVHAVARFPWLALSAGGDRRHEHIQTLQADFKIRMR